MRPGGKVMEVNSSLDKNPAAVNKDPYGEGWMVVIKPSNIGDVDALLSPGDYKALVEAQPGN